MRLKFVILLCFTGQLVIAQPMREIVAARNGDGDLSFLDTLLLGKRVVMLGESSHGTEQYSQVKFQLIRYLHEKLGYEVLLFEAPMAACSYLPLATDTSAIVRLRSSLQSFWHTETIASLMRYARLQGLVLGGFDPQFARSPYSFAFYQQVLADYPAVRDTFLQLEGRVNDIYANPSVYLPLRDSLAKAYLRQAHQMDALEPTLLQQWVKQMAIVNSRYYSGLTKGDTRDACMAANIIWLAENLYCGEKDHTMGAQHTYR